jgi:hydrogenase maturation factor
LAVTFPVRFIEAGGRDFQAEAEGMFYQMSVMDDCAIAREFAGVRVMHDATECGIWGGLYEMARAGEYGLRVEQESIPIQPVVSRTAELFDFDPFCAISEGTLVIIVDKNEAADLNSALREKGIVSGVVGEVVSKEKGLTVVSRKEEIALEHPRVDPYWTLAEKLSKVD